MRKFQLCIHYCQPSDVHNFDDLWTFSAQVTNFCECNFTEVKKFRNKNFGSIQRKNKMLDHRKSKFQKSFSVKKILNRKSMTIEMMCIWHTFLTGSVHSSDRFFKLQVFDCNQSIMNFNRASCNGSCLTKLKNGLTSFDLRLC